METQICGKCGARFMEGVLYWSTGKSGKKEDLAGLVCDKYGDVQCINEVKGTVHNGQTWEKRAAFLEGVAAATKALENKLKDE